MAYTKSADGIAKKGKTDVQIFPNSGPTQKEMKGGKGKGKGNNKNGNKSVSVKVSQPIAQGINAMSQSINSMGTTAINALPMAQPTTQALPDYNNMQQQEMGMGSESFEPMAANAGGGSFGGAFWYTIK